MTRSSGVDENRGGSLGLDRDRAQRRGRAVQAPCSVLPSQRSNSKATEGGQRAERAEQSRRWTKASEVNKGKGCPNQAKARPRNRTMVLPRSEPARGDAAGHVISPTVKFRREVRGCVNFFRKRKIPKKEIVT